MVAARVKLARQRKWVRIDGSPSIVKVQPCPGVGQCFGYSPPTVHRVSISISVSPARRPFHRHRWPAVLRSLAAMTLVRIAPRKRSVLRSLRVVAAGGYAVEMSVEARATLTECGV
jgi:hypothetical protein